MAGSYSLSGISTNWKITIHFRHADGSDDKNNNNHNRILLCTLITNNQCVTGGTLTPGTLYLLRESSTGGNFNDDNSLDGFARERYDLQSCDSSTSGVRDSKCNHVAAYEVEGIPSWSGYSPFHCQAGECDIGVGPAASLSTTPSAARK